MSRISHFSYKSDAIAIKKSKNAGVGAQSRNDLKVENEYNSGSVYFTSNVAQPQPGSTQDGSAANQQRQKGKRTNQVPKQGNYNTLLKYGHNQPKLLQNSFTKKGDQQLNMRGSDYSRNLLSRQQKSNSFDCDAQISEFDSDNDKEMKYFGSFDLD